ncbi:hypothetical protein F4818DRAFT_18119 [Hypoxylon cercidicola]|nr:hypothetical protein F4818DRAFT_18119 [Hypoxylon cercidicola]
MTLLVIMRSDRGDLVREAQEALRAVNLDLSVLSEGSIRVFYPDNSSMTGGSEVQVYVPTPSHRLTELGIAVKTGYGSYNYLGLFGPATYRPDFYIYALENDIEGLVGCFGILRNRLR